jgi:3-dehydroquinate synthase
VVETSGGGSYPVRIGAGVLESLPMMLEERVRSRHLAVIADDRVAGLHAGRVMTLLEGSGHRVDLYTFPEGEASKSRKEWARLTDAILEGGMGRDGCLIALGGGVTGDLVGFVAATFMRGIPVVQIPTSLVAMIDSSVGGKTGIDLPGGKNLAGAFHPPRFVLIDPELAATLPPEERAQGLMEALKHGAILDRSYFDLLRADAKDLLDGEVAPTVRAVRRSVDLKADVVGQDEREAGIRQILNFGHTLGHALEAESGYRLPHGTAVARGMVLEARLGERLGVTRPATADRIAAAVRDFGIDPTVEPLGRDEVDRILRHTERDKKVRDGATRYVLIEEIGVASPADGWSRVVGSREVEAVLSFPGGETV